MYKEMDIAMAIFKKAQRSRSKMKSLPVVLQRQQHPGALDNSLSNLLDKTAIIPMSALHTHLLAKIAEQVEHTLDVDAGGRFASKAATTRYTQFFGSKKLAAVTFDRSHDWMNAFVALGPAQDKTKAQLLIYELQALIESELEAEEEMLYTPWPMQYVPEDWLGSIGSGKPTLFAAASSAASSSSSLSSSSSRRSRSRSSQKQGNTIMKVALKHNIPPTNVIKYVEAADGAPYNDKETSPAAPTTRLRLL